MQLIKIIKISLVFSFIFFVSACALKRHDPASIATPVGKSCVAKCFRGESYCQSLCDLKRKSCVTRAKKEAQKAFDLYRVTQLSHQLPVKKNLTDFDHANQCETACNCEEFFETCYKSCSL